MISVKYRSVVPTLVYVKLQMTEKIPQELARIAYDEANKRIDAFITQIKNMIAPQKRGVYIVTVNDLYCFHTRIFGSFTECEIKPVEERLVPEEIRVAYQKEKPSIAQHLKSRKLRIHTIILSYCCRDTDGNVMFTMDGPIS